MRCPSVDKAFATGLIWVPFFLAFGLADSPYDLQTKLILTVSIIWGIGATTVLWITTK